MSVASICHGQYVLMLRSVPWNVSKSPATISVNDRSQRIPLSIQDCLCLSARLKFNDNTKLKSRLVVSFGHYTAIIDMNSME